VENEFRILSSAIRRIMDCAGFPYHALWQTRSHEVRPGITGWAQVNGKDTLTWDEKSAPRLVSWSSLSLARDNNYRRDRLEDDYLRGDQLSGGSDDAEA
jgi:hypothetical protein